MQGTLFHDHKAAAVSRRSDSETSREAESQLRPRLAGLQQVAFDAASGDEQTANEIALRGSVAGNCCRETLRKRVRELVRRGMLVETGRRKCRVTGKAAATFRRCSDAE
ncbi:MAG: hypothetical protein EBT13_18955 [Rhodobacteraceae bacterium]|nr:hypothetical protein [Paracoccaceae bacterium]